MKRNETIITITKLTLAAIYLSTILIIGDYILNSSFKTETQNSFLVGFHIISNFFDLIINYTEFILIRLLGFLAGKFLFLCLNSWVLGLIAALFLSKKFQYHQIIKMGIL